jgi:hypothetical protein
LISSPQDEEADMHDPVRVIIRHAFNRYGNRLRGRFVASLDGRQLCISQNPFAAAASILINAGYDPALPIAGRPAEANFDTLTSTIGEAAKWTCTHTRWPRDAPIRRGGVPRENIL